MKVNHMLQHYIRAVRGLCAHLIMIYVMSTLLLMMSFSYIYSFIPPELEDKVRISLSLKTNWASIGVFVFVDQIIAFAILLTCMLNVTKQIKMYCPCPNDVCSPENDESGDQLTVNNRCRKSNIDNETDII